MNKPVVIDASAAAPWLIPEERSAVTDQLFADVMSSRGTYFAPALWLWETANILLVSLRRRRVAQDGFDAGLGLLTRVAPALNAFTMSFPLKIMLTLTLVSVIFVALPGIVGNLTGQAIKVLAGVG